MKSQADNVTSKNPKKHSKIISQQRQFSSLVQHSEKIENESAKLKAKTYSQNSEVEHAQTMESAMHGSSSPVKCSEHTTALFSQFI